jgi:hypothetical protein
VQIAMRLLFAGRHRAVASVNTNTAAIITAASTKHSFKACVLLCWISIKTPTAPRQALCVSHAKTHNTFVGCFWWISYRARTYYLSRHEWTQFKDALSDQLKSFILSGASIKTQ